MCGTEPGLQAGSTGQARAWPYDQAASQTPAGQGTRKMSYGWSRHHGPMRSLLWLVGAASVCAVGCTVTRVPAAPTPSPRSASPTPQPPAPQPAPSAQAPRGGGPWQFAPAAGTYSYVLMTDARIDRVGDSTTAATSRTLPTTTQRVTLAIFSTGDVQVVDPPVPASGTPCDAAAALVPRAHELIPRIPPTLAAGATWTDSTNVDGCRGTIPATTHRLSRYTVIGDTNVAGVAALQIHRADSITATGDGTQGQHHITFTATGTGSAELYLDPPSGRFLGADETQETTVDVTTSGRTERFQQHVHERATLAPGTPSPTL